MHTSLSNAEINQQLALHVHDEDFLMNLEASKNQDFSPRMIKFYREEALNIPFIDVLKTNEHFNIWVKNMPSKFNIKPSIPNEWISSEVYWDKYPHLVKEIHQMFQERFPKLSGFVEVLILTYICEGEISPTGVKEAMERKAITSVDKHIDPISGAISVYITYTLDEHCTLSNIGLTGIDKEIY